MIEQFYNYQSTTLGVLQLLIIVAIGFVLSVKKLINKDGCNALSTLLIWVCLPALIFTKITVSFDPLASPTWWFLPICSILMAAVGMLVGYGVLFLLPSFKARRELMLSCGFQNCGYLPMALIAFVCSGEACNMFLVYVFLFIIGFNITIWPFSMAFLQKDFRKNFKWHTILNPPAISTIIAIGTVFIFKNSWLPAAIGEPLKLVGDASFPLALILLGAMLKEHGGYHLGRAGALAGCLIAKLVLIPIVCLIVLKFLNLDPMYTFIIFLQSTMPTAVTLVVIGDAAHADVRFLSSTILYTHIGASMTVPVWLMIFNQLM